MRGWIASLLTAACVVFLVANTNLTEIERALQQADYRLLALAFAISTATVVVKGLRWCRLYPAWARPSVGLAVAGVAAGQVANWAAPFRAGEVIRVGLVSASDSAERARSVAAGVGVLLVEKLLDAALLLVTVGVLVVLVGVPEWLSRTALLLALVGCTVGLAVAVRLRRRAPSDWSALGRSWLSKLAPSRGAAMAVPGHFSAAPLDSPLNGVRPLQRWLISLFGRTPRAAWLFEDVAGLTDGLSAWLTLRVAVQALAWSVIAWALGGAINYVVFRSVNVDPHQALAATLAILAALYGAAIVPTLPGRLGFFQYVCVMTLAPFGVAFEPALVFSLALYLAVYLPPVGIGLASMLFIGPAPWRWLTARDNRK